MAEPLFKDVKQIVESDDPDVTEIESYCVNCGDSGTTRLLLTEIPFFRQVVIMSFHCEHCNFSNNELQPAAQIAERGIRYELKVKSIEDLKRQLVKTEWAVVKIPEVEFEVSKQTGLITTVEGILDRAISGLKYSHENSPASAEEKKPLEDFINKMLDLKEGRSPFTLIIEDASGNSFVENPKAPEVDPQLEVSHYIRTIEEDRLLGIYSDENNAEQGKDNLKDEVLQFPTNCPQCNAPCMTNMKVTDIPHFKEVIIMATNCPACAHVTNEIKPGAGIEPQGVKITLSVATEAELKKVVVVSDTCSLSIPELQLEFHPSGAGRLTTVEGLGLLMIEDLQRTNPFIDGDSTREEVREKIGKLCEKLKNLIGTTIVLDDPCGNSFVEDVGSIERYERSFEQNEELGLNDMKVEGYQDLKTETIQEEEE